MPTEPPDVAIALSAFVNAIGGLLIAFNVVLTQVQLGAILTVVNTGFGLGWLIFRKAKPTPPTPPAPVT